MTNCLMINHIGLTAIIKKLRVTRLKHYFDETSPSDDSILLIFHPNRYYSTSCNFLETKEDISRGCDFRDLDTDLTELSLAFGRAVEELVYIKEALEEYSQRI